MNALNGLVVDPKIKIVIVTAYTEYKSEELLNIAEKGGSLFFPKAVHPGGDHSIGRHAHR